jgi:hypothetical protein
MYCCASHPLTVAAGYPAVMMAVMTVYRNLPVEPISSPASADITKGIDSPPMWLSCMSYTLHTWFLLGTALIPRTIHNVTAIKTTREVDSCGLKFSRTLATCQRYCHSCI